MRHSVQNIGKFLIVQELHCETLLFLSFVSLGIQTFEERIRVLKVDQNSIYLDAHPRRVLNIEIAKIARQRLLY